MATVYPLDLYFPTFSYLSRTDLLQRARLLSRYSNRVVNSKKLRTLHTTTIHLLSAPDLVTAIRRRRDSQEKLIKYVGVWARLSRKFIVEVDGFKDEFRLQDLVRVLVVSQQKEIDVIIRVMDTVVPMDVKEGIRSMEHEIYALDIQKYGTRVRRVEFGTTCVDYYMLRSILHIFARAKTI